MAEAIKNAGVGQPPPLRLSRVFDASRETVFKAWSTADHVKRWFSPETYTVSDATVDMRAGGAFNVCMRAPDGEEHWMRGNFVEVTGPAGLDWAGEGLAGVEFIDYNNDGILEDIEQVLNSQNNTVHTTVVTPSVFQCLGVPVRMRVITDNRFNQIYNACYNPAQGQVEDYSVKIINPASTARRPRSEPPRR